jgi:hypothetical protein
MDNATIIGIVMTVVAVFVFIGYKRGWIK